jgi:mannosyl-3-phosphoglycerate phosphatase
MKVVFTDLDGSLLDAATYRWDAAQPALDLLASHGVPWVMVSSKTRAEMEALRREIGHTHPFVVENGGAAFIPRGYFGREVEGAAHRDGYEVLEWGAPYLHLVEALQRAAARTHCPVVGFHQMSLEQVREATGLAAGPADLARRREYDEPFLAPDEFGVPALLDAIEEAGFRWTHGGRFHHICGNNDKATAVSALIRLYARQYGAVESIGLGDGLNDLPMLLAVDYPVLIRSEREPPVQLRNTAARYTERIGPAGWNEAVMEFLTRSAQR